MGDVELVMESRYVVARGRNQQNLAGFKARPANALKMCAENESDARYIHTLRRMEPIPSTLCLSLAAFLLISLGPCDEDLRNRSLTLRCHLHV